MDKFIQSLQWIFDGIGTELISLIIGLIVGGLGGYKVGKNKFHQSQKAGDNSTQHQSLTIMSRANSSYNNSSSALHADNCDAEITGNKVSQSQKAGDNSQQEQVNHINVR